MAVFTTIDYALQAINALILLLNTGSAARAEAEYIRDALLAMQARPAGAQDPTPEERAVLDARVKAALARLNRP